MVCGLELEQHSYILNPYCILNLNSINNYSGACAQIYQRSLQFYVNRNLYMCAFSVLNLCSLISITPVLLMNPSPKTLSLYYFSINKHHNYWISFKCLF